MEDALVRVSFTVSVLVKSVISISLLRNGLV
jgi:hypothetical protein